MKYCYTLTEKARIQNLDRIHRRQTEMWNTEILFIAGGIHR